METLFYMTMGIIATVFVSYAYQKYRQHPISARGWIFFLAGLGLFLFGVAWAQISVREHEIQAAVMGIVFFSGTGVILGYLAWRQIMPVKKNKDKSTGSDAENRATPTSISANTLLFLCAILLPVALFLHSVGGVIFHPEKMTDLVVDNLISDAALPKTIKKAMVYNVQYGSDEMVLDDRVLIGISGSVDAKEWVELFDMVAPEQTRVAIAKEGVEAVNAWLDNTKDYPELEIQPGVFVSRLTDNAENVIQWIFRATLFPPYEVDSVFPHCDEAILQNYKDGIFSDDLKELIGCKPPAEYRDIIAPHAATLLKAKVSSADIPESIQLKEKIAETMTPSQMQTQKKQAQTLRNVTRFLWILPILLFIGGMVIIVTSGGSFATPACWHIALSGILSLILSFLLKCPDTLIGIMIPKLSEALPAPALGIIQNLATGLFLQVGQTLFMAAMIMVGTGLFFCILGYKDKFFR